MIFLILQTNFSALEVEMIEREIKRVLYILCVGGGALTMINVDKLRKDDILKLSGWASLIWVSVTKDNLEKTLKLMDSTITKKVV